jgi:ribosomal protein L18E
MPLIRRLPKRGFNNAAFHKRYAIVNLDDIKAFKAGTVVNEQLLRESNLVRGSFVGIKILGDGELKHGLKVEADKVSTAAREKIEKAGGTIALRDGRAAEARAPHKDTDLTRQGSPAAETTSLVAEKKGSTRKLAARAKTPKKKTSRKS